jgi:hypothetical protein
MQGASEEPSTGTMKRFSARNHGRRSNVFGSSHLINAILKKSARTNTPPLSAAEHPCCFRGMGRNCIHQRRRQAVIGL